MTIEQQLHDHQAKRPEMPRPFAPDSPEGIEWHAAFTLWVREKERLLGRLAIRDKFHPERRAIRAAMRGGLV